MQATYFLDWHCPQNIYLLSGYSVLAKPAAAEDVCRPMTYSSEILKIVFSGLYTLDVFSCK